MFGFNGTKGVVLSLRCHSAIALRGPSPPRLSLIASSARKYCSTPSLLGTSSIVPFASGQGCTRQNRSFFNSFLRTRRTSRAQNASGLQQSTHLSRRCFASRKKPTSTSQHGQTTDHVQPEPVSNQDASGPITSRLNETRKKTSDLTAKVKSSLTNLTPHENIYNIPNFLTASRLVAAPVIAYLIVRGDLKWALGLFVYAGMTDLVDGWMARKFKLQTVVGSVIDPMADKTLMTVMTASLAVKGLMPAYLATLILGRDVALAIAAIYYRYASLPTPKTMARYWDFSLPSAEVHPTTLSKYNTFLQLMLIGATLALPVLAAEPVYTQILDSIGQSDGDVHMGLTYYQCLVAGTTAWSGMSYAFLKNAVTIIGTDEALKAKQGARGRAIIGVLFGGIVLASAWLAVFRDGVTERVEASAKVKKT